jgi:uncharacterized protein (UPF0276 family)
MHGLADATRGSTSVVGVRGIGIGLRAAHYPEFLRGAPAVDWLEVHSENYFGDGGYDLHVLEHVRKDYPLSLHGVGLSLGSSDCLRTEHLARLKRLVDRIQPGLVSEHLSWGAFGARHFNDLLPMPFTQETLRLMTARVTQTQETLQRRILVENVSSYLAYRASEMSEGEFLAELARHSGCGILLDVNNLFVNARNHGFDASEALAAFPAQHVGEIHLAGHRAMDDLLIDDHGSQVAPAVWTLYAHACRRFGPVPALIEWDSGIPPLDVLVGEARTAKAVQASANG